MGTYPMAKNLVETGISSLSLAVKELMVISPRDGGLSMMYKPIILIFVLKSNVRTFQRTIFYKRGTGFNYKWKEGIVKG